MRLGEAGKGMLFRVREIGIWEVGKQMGAGNDRRTCEFKMGKWKDSLSLSLSLDISTSIRGTERTSIDWTAFASGGCSEMEQDHSLPQKEVQLIIQTQTGLDTSRLPPPSLLGSQNKERRNTLPKQPPTLSFRTVQLPPPWPSSLLVRKTVTPTL